MSTAISARTRYFLINKQNNVTTINVISMLLYDYMAQQSDSPIPDSNLQAWIKQHCEFMRWTMTTKYVLAIIYWYWSRNILVTFQKVNELQPSSVMTPVCITRGVLDSGHLKNYLSWCSFIAIRTLNQCVWSLMHYSNVYINGKIKQTQCLLYAHRVYLFAENNNLNIRCTESDKQSRFSTNMKQFMR